MQLKLLQLLSSTAVYDLILLLLLLQELQELLQVRLTSASDLLAAACKNGS